MGALSERLKERRQVLGLSLATVAEKTGLSKGYLSELENGWGMPEADALYQLADAYGCTMEHLLGREPLGLPTPGEEAEHRVMMEIQAERRSQQALHGEQADHPERWLAILSEEHLQLTRDTLAGHSSRSREEANHVAAVAAAYAVFLNTCREMGDLNRAAATLREHPDYLLFLERYRMARRAWATSEAVRTLARESGLDERGYAELIVGAGWPAPAGGGKSPLRQEQQDLAYEAAPT